MEGEGELTFDGEEIKIWLGEFLQEVGMSKFWLVRGTYTYVLYIYIYKRLCQQVFIYNDEAFCTSHTSCAGVAILLLQDLNTLCVTYIYMVCIFTYLFSVRDTIHISHHEHF